MRWAAPYLLLQLACTAKPVPFAEAAAKAEQATEPAPANAAAAATAVVSGPPNLLTVADIRIAPGAPAPKRSGDGAVDTTHAPTLDAVNCLRRFLTRKMDPEAPLTCSRRGTRAGLARGEERM